MVIFRAELAQWLEESTADCEVDSSIPGQNHSIQYRAGTLCKNK